MHAPNEPYRLLGIPLTPDLVMKLLALVFALGVLYNRMGSLEDKIESRIKSQNVIIETKMEGIDWRLKQVETKIDRAEQRDFDRARQEGTRR